MIQKTVAEPVSAGLVRGQWSGPARLDLSLENGRIVFTALPDPPPAA